MDNISAPTEGSARTAIPGEYAARQLHRPLIFQEGPTDSSADVHLRQRHYTYQTPEGLVVGATMSVMFTVDRPTKDVWPHFKDFNRWQNPYGYYYSGVVGDLEGETFALGKKDDLGPLRYEVIRVIPEHTIVIFEPIPKDGHTGGISPGFHVFVLTEHSGKTVISVAMEHAYRTQKGTEEEALAQWRDGAPEVQRMWRDSFIPDLKILVCGSMAAGATSRTPNSDVT